MILLNSHRIINAYEWPDSSHVYVVFDDDRHMPLFVRGVDDARIILNHCTTSKAKNVLTKLILKLL
jgi:hypothetical protein